MTIDAHGNLIIHTAMALPRRYQRTSLISIESLGAYFQLLKVCTQDEVEQRFRGSIEVWPSIVWFLNGLPKSAAIRRLTV
jgi:hypothetical protein